MRDDEWNRGRRFDSKGIAKEAARWSRCASFVLLAASTLTCGQAPEEEVGVHESAISVGHCPTFTDDQACICTDQNFLGSCVIVNNGTHFYPTPAQFGLPDKSISSMVAGGHVKLRYCNSIQMGGTCSTLIGTTGGVGTGRLAAMSGTPGDNAISSLRVDKPSDLCNLPQSNQVSIYANVSFGGDCSVLTLPAGFQQAAFPNTVGTSDANGLGGSFGLPSDAISSLKVGTGVRLVAYRDAQTIKGIQTLYETGAQGTLGDNVNETLSALVVLPKNGSTVPYHYIGESGFDEFGAVGFDLQGIAHDASYWYLTNRTGIYKFNLTDDLGNGAVNPVAHVGIPPILQSYGCNHFGDPDQKNGYLFVPVEGCHDPSNITRPQPFVAVFNTSDLTLNCADFLYFQAEKAPLLAINPVNGFLYATHDRVASNVPAPSASAPIYVYTIMFDRLDARTCELTRCASNDFSACLLFNGPGSSTQDVSPGGVGVPGSPSTPDGFLTPQGAAFSDDGKLFFMTNGSPATSIFGSCTDGVNGGGLHVFDTTVSPWQHIAESSWQYGPFEYEFQCGFSNYEEPEGMDYLDMIGKGGAFTGHLHVLLYSNSDAQTGGTLGWLKHYSLF